MLQPALGETIYVGFKVESAAGTLADADSTPTVIVFEDGGASTLTGASVTKRTALTGKYYATVVCTTGNGFEAGKSYEVEITAVIGGVTKAIKAGDFTLRTGSVDSDSSGVTTLLSRLSSARAGYLDNLGIDGVVASYADILAINQSASRRIMLVTVSQYERPETGSTTYTVEARTYDGDGAAVNADSTPTLAAVGIVSGSLNANLSVASQAATGVYRWTYTVSSAATLEQVRFDVSAVLSVVGFTLSTYTQVVDFVAATFTTTDRANIDTLLTRVPGTVQPQTGDAYARIGTNGAGLTAIPWNAAWDAEVQSEVEDGLAVYGPLKPTVAGRTLDVSATGEAGIDWANVGSPTTTLNLSGTTIGVVAAVTGPVYVIINGEGYSNGVIVIRKGDSYGATSGKQLTVTKPTGASWPSNLASLPWTVTFQATKVSTGDGTAASVLGPITCTLNSATSVEVPLTAAQTAALVLHTKATDDVSGWTWELQASTGAGLLRNTLVSGTMTVLSEQIVG